MHEQQCKLLIVDDRPEDTTIVRVLIEDWGGRNWHFVEEDNGESALDRLETEEVDCILLDYQLLEMNGLRFLKEMTARYGSLRFPVVMLTGSGRTSVAVEALKSGAQDYISKDNLRVDALIRSIDNAIERVALLREREKQRRELEEANARLRLLEAAIEAASDSVVITEAGLDHELPRIVFVNRAFTRMTGYSAAEVLGQTPRFVKELEHFKLQSGTGHSYWGHTIDRRKDGGEFMLEWDLAPITDSGGRTTHYVAIQRDSTAKHRTEEMLRESEERLEMALRGADLGLWDWDCVTSRVVYDEGWASMLGYRLSDIDQTFEAWSRLVHPDDLPVAVEALKKHLQGESTAYEAVFRMLTADGAWCWIQARGKVLSRMPDGRPRRAAGTHLDVTDRHNAEVSLRRSNEELQQFAYAAGHDLQEPLRMMLSYSQLLQRRIGENLDETSDRLLRTIQSGAERATRLTKDLLAYAVHSTTDQNLFNEAFSFEEALATVLSTFADRIAENGAEITHGPLPVVNANRAQMIQLLQNLVGNALKYSRKDTPPRIHIFAELIDQNWRFSVRDNGIGFESNFADYIFGPFRRLNPADNSGSGLGLAMCRRVIENHGGRIWAESSPGLGSTFFFTLPLTMTAAAAGCATARYESR